MARCYDCKDSFSLLHSTPDYRDPFPLKSVAVCSGCFAERETEGRNRKGIPYVAR